VFRSVDHLQAVTSYYTSHRMFNVPKNTFVLEVSYKNTFEFVKYVKLYSNLKILSYKLKSKVKTAVLSLGAQPMFLPQCERQGFTPV
jgi:hypothetical protein